MSAAWSSWQSLASEGQGRAPQLVSATVTAGDQGCPHSCDLTCPYQSPLLQMGSLGFRQALFPAHHMAAQPQKAPLFSVPQFTHLWDGERCLALKTY